MYGKKILGGAIVLAIAIALLAVITAGANSGSGAIWTTNGDCGDETQDENHFEVGDPIYINGANFKPGDYQWTITGKPGGASSDPGQVVASGNMTVDASGAFCFAAYVVQPDDDGEYQVKFGNKGDNYRVEGKDEDECDDDDNHCPPQSSKTPTLTNTPVPTNTSVPTATNTSVPTNTPHPTNTGAPTNTSVSTNTSVVPTNVPTKTPKATKTSSPTATNTLPVPIATALPPAITILTAAPPSSPLSPFCEMNAVNATEDKRVEIAFTWRNVAAIVGTWGDGESITGLPNQEAGFAIISHQYAADRQVAQILIVVGKGAEKHVCTVNIVFDTQPVAAATSVTSNQSQSQEVNIGLFSGDGSGAPVWILWCIIGILFFGVLFAMVFALANAVRRA